MSLLSEVLKDYFEDEATTPRSTRLGILRESKLPISANESSWEIHTDPERFSKKFKFKTRQRLMDFVSEVLKLEDQMYHHGNIKISYDEVIIDVYTHNVNKITELDQEYARSVDFIYRDVLDFEYTA